MFPTASQGVSRYEAQRNRRSCDVPSDGAGTEPPGPAWDERLRPGAAERGGSWCPAGYSLQAPGGFASALRRHLPCQHIVWGSRRFRPPRAVIRGSSAQGWGETVSSSPAGSNREAGGAAARTSQPPPPRQDSTSLLGRAGPADGEQPPALTAKKGCPRMAGGSLNTGQVVPTRQQRTSNVFLNRSRNPGPRAAVRRRLHVGLQPLKRPGAA